MFLKNSNDIWGKIQNGIFIIAEAGKNFIQTQEERSVQEYLDNAKKLVDASIDAGADAIKFQTHQVEDEQLDIDVVSPHFKGSDRYNWVSRNTKATPLDTFWKPLKAYCDEKGIAFLSTPMSRGAAKLLDDLGMQFWKIGSGDILDFVMLDYMRNTAKPIIISSGMSTLEEVERAISFLREKNDKVALLHCVSKYPCPPEDLHLQTISFYKKKFTMPIGFSDHSLSIESAQFAVVLGATILEKHFSMSRDLWGADHQVSLTPLEFKQLVEKVRYTQKYLASETKVLQEGEAVFRPLFRKSLVAGRHIPEGAVITADMVYAMRPQAYAGGLPSEEYVNVIGRKVKKALKKYEPITFDILEL